MVDFGHSGENVDPSWIELLDELLGVEANRRVWEVVGGCNRCGWLSYLNCANLRGNRRGRREDIVDGVIWDLRFGSGGRLDGMGAVEMVIAGGLCVIVIGWPGLSAIRKVRCCWDCYGLWFGRTKS